MDSDDEFMSGLSDSQDEDFGAQEDSDDGSLGDGMIANYRRKRGGFPTLLTYLHL